MRVQLVVVRNLNQSLVAGAAWSWPRVGTISIIPYIAVYQYGFYDLYLDKISNIILNFVSKNAL